MATRYVNTASTAGGDGTTNATAGANRAYASLSEWEAARQGDLVTATDGEVVHCCGTTADTTNVTIDGWTTNATYYIDIRANVSDGAGRSFLARYSTSFYRIEAGGSWTIDVQENYTRLTGIQVSTTSAFSAIRVGSATNCLLDSCVFKNTNNDGVECRNCDNTRFTNCLAIGCAGRGFASYNGATVGMDNCVSVGNGTNGFYGNSFGLTVRNCYAGGNSGDDYSVVSTLTTCRSEDGTQSTTTAAYSTSSGCYFTNVTGGSQDLQIGASSELINVGTDLSATFTTDIAGVTRPTGASTWDVGVWEFQSGGGGRTVLNTRSNPLGVDIGMGWRMPY